MENKIFTEFEKGYLAGLLEGEGCLVMSGKKDKTNKYTTYQARIQISNSNTDLLNRINEIYFGSINCSNKKDGIFNWIIYDQHKIVNFLEQLLPYLIVKKDRAEKMLEFCKSRLNSKWNRASYTLEELEIGKNWTKTPKNCGKDFISNNCKALRA
jgi:hypothetical protein